MTQQNAVSHLGLFCLPREISSKNGIKKNKIPPDAPKNENVLTQNDNDGKSNGQKWVKQFTVQPAALHYLINMMLS